MDSLGSRIIKWRQCVWLICGLLMAFQSVAAQSDDASIEGAQNLTLKEGEVLPRSQTGQDIHQEIQSVLKGKDFGEEKTRKQWQWIDTEDEEVRQEKFPQWIIDVLDFFRRNKDTIATIATVLEVLLWAAFAGLILFIVVRYRQNIGQFISGSMNKTPEPELPASLMGIDLKKVVLPNDIPSEAALLWQRQQPRKALALLLRASLIKLLKEHRVTLYDSDTEAECCDRIEQQAPAEVSDFMRDLVSAWQSLAYAHVVPSDATFASLCTRWSTVFRTTNKMTRIKSTEATNAE